MKRRKKMKNPEFGKHLTTVLKTMCEKVGVSFEDVDFSSQDWYMKQEWSMGEQEDFKDWMVDYLYRHVGARRELTYCPKDKKCLRKAANMFLFSYGWKFRED